MHKKFNDLIVAVVLALSCLMPAMTFAAMPATVAGVHDVYVSGDIKVAFSPDGGITGMIVNEINNATKSVYVQAYSFTSPDIANALIAAKNRGLDVAVIVDKSQETANYTEADDLTAAGVPVHTDKAFAIAHSKIMVVDGSDVITGSFNFTRAAEMNNAENCLILKDSKDMAALYMDNWYWRWDETQDYVRQG